MHLSMTSCWYPQLRKTRSEFTVLIKKYLQQGVYEASTRKETLPGYKIYTWPLLLHLRVLAFAKQHRSPVYP